jgi:hypothetical protein
MATNSTSGPEVTFILPCLNEAESLAHVLHEIRASFEVHDCSYEIVLADNGSTDGSQLIATSGGARVVDVETRGYGAALLGGIASARGKLGVMGDADGSYSFGDSWPMILQLREGADLVIGDRFAGGIAPGAMPWLHKYFGNPVLSTVGRVLYRVPISDFHCGLRAFSIERIEGLGLHSSGMEFASEMIVAARKGGLEIREVPVSLGPDLRSRAPHLRTWRDGWRHLRFLFAHSPTWTFLVPAVIAGAMTLFVWWVALSGPVQAGRVEFSYRTAVLALVLAVLSTTASWSFVLARAIVTRSRPSIPYAMELSAIASLVVFLAGIAIMVAQFFAWQDAAFGTEPVGQVLLGALWGVLLIAVGGISLLFSLLVGLVRAIR